MASMEHPIFSLSKKRDLRDIIYRNGEVTITVKPTSDGLPTIFDKDVLLYCGSIKREVIKAFGLIESYEIVESSRVKNRMIRLEITLSDWFYHSILGKEVLTINRDYFRLGKALERRLYEIARKHCGQGSEWKIGLEKLKEKTGSTSPLKKFRFFIREIEKQNHLPDYTISLSDNDLVVFCPEKNL